MPEVQLQLGTAALTAQLEGGVLVISTEEWINAGGSIAGQDVQAGWEEIPEAEQEPPVVTEVDKTIAAYEYICGNRPSFEVLVFPRPTRGDACSPDLLRSNATALSDLQGFSSVQRLARAYEAGQSANQVLIGETTVPRATPPLTGISDQKIFVVLRGLVNGQLVRLPHFVRTKYLYNRAVRPNGNFHSGTVSHSFPSLIEAKFYCYGAGYSLNSPIEVKQ